MYYVSMYYVFMYIYLTEEIYEQSWARVGNFNECNWDCMCKNQAM